MFALKLVTCVLGFMCETEQVDAIYLSDQRCHGQAAIISGIKKAQAPQFAETFGWTATCVNLFDATYTVTTGGTSAQDVPDLSLMQPLDPAGDE